MDEIVGQGEQLARTFVAAVGSGNPVSWAAMFTDDATYAVPDLPNPLRGRDALEAMAATFFKAFPDMAFEVRSVIEQGNVVVLEGATKGTFTGPMMTARRRGPADRQLLRGTSRRRVRGVRDRAHYSLP